MELLFEALCTLLGIYLIVLIVRVVLSWVPRPPEPLTPLINVVTAVTEPVMGPVRRLLPTAQLGGIGLDLSPILVFLGVGILRSLFCGAATGA